MSGYTSNYISNELDSGADLLDVGAVKNLVVCHETHSIGEVVKQLMTASEHYAVIMSDDQAIGVVAVSDMEAIDFTQPHQFSASITTLMKPIAGMVTPNVAVNDVVAMLEKAQAEYALLVDEHKTPLRVIRMCEAQSPISILKQVITTSSDVSLGKASQGIAQTVEYINQLLKTLSQQEAELDKKASLFSAFLDALPNPIFVKDNNLIFIACNSAYEEAFGIKREEFIGKSVMELEYLPYESRLAFQKDDERLVRSRGMTKTEINITFADGVSRAALYQRRTFVSGNGSGGMLGLIVDISERKRAENYERFRSEVLQTMANGADLDTTLGSIVKGIEQLNPNMLCCILLLDEQGRRVTRVFAPSISDTYNAYMIGLNIGYGEGSSGTAAYTGELVIVDDIATHPYWEKYRSYAQEEGLRACWSQPIWSDTQEVFGVFAIYHREPTTPTEYEIEMIKQTARLASLIMVKMRAEETIRHLAFYDSLTQLPNRRLMSEHLNQALEESAQTQDYHAVALLDLDNFKPLNDEHGHAAGDALLVEVAKRLSDSVGEGGIVARLGGDEFVALWRYLGEDAQRAEHAALQVAEKVRHALSRPYELQLDLDVITHRCTCSMGVVVFSGREHNFGQVLKLADQAMYDSKERGRNQVTLAG